VNNKTYAIYNYLKINEILYTRFLTPTALKDFKLYINKVVQTKTEPIGLLKHASAWKNVPNIMFIHYTQIPFSETIDEFLGVPVGTCAQFKIIERTSVKSSFETSEYLAIVKRFDTKLKTIAAN